MPVASGRVLRCGPDVLCLQFVNTVAWRRSGAPEERLLSPCSLLDWCVGAGVLDVRYASHLRARWEQHPREARAVHQRALGLREAIYDLFRFRILSEANAEGRLRIINDTLAAVPPRTRIALSGDALGWWANSVRPSPLDMLAPIAWSAADLATGPRAQRVRQCEDVKGCGWLFLDESRAGTRRWCSMGECGNRAKARRHYLRSQHLEAADAHGAKEQPN
jgi:predicted RNA-binding Zn ribbon-like protein